MENPGLKELFGTRRNVAIILAVSALAFSLSYYLTVLPVTGLSIETYADMNGFWYTAMTLGMSAIISVLFGVWVALVSSTARPGVSGFLGTLVGAAATGCPTCGAPLLALAGFPLGLFHLPFWGLELKAASVILLLVSIYLVDKNCGKCRCTRDD